MRIVSSKRSVYFLYPNISIIFSYALYRHIHTYGLFQFVDHDACIWSWWQSEIEEDVFSLEMEVHLLGKHPERSPDSEYLVWFAEFQALCRDPILLEQTFFLVAHEAVFGCQEKIISDYRSGYQHGLRIEWCFSSEVFWITEKWDIFLFIVKHSHRICFRLIDAELLLCHIFGVYDDISIQDLQSFLRPGMDVFVEYLACVGLYLEYGILLVL